MSTKPKPVFAPFKHHRTFEMVSNKIKKLIFDGVFKPGDKLPPETELAQQFNVGRQSVREALRILELSGFIRIQKGGGGGAVIKDTISDTIGNLFLDAFQLEKISIEELTIARIEIEKIILKYVIQNADESDIRYLQENLRKTKEKAKKNLIVIDENIHFHKLLAKASKNPLFIIVSEAIITAVRQVWIQLRPDSDLLNNEKWHNDSTINSKNTIKYHEKILNAIIARDLEEAVVQLEKHLEEVKNRLQLLGSQPCK